MTRQYSSISVETTLNSGINTTATTIVLPSVGAATSLMGGITLAPSNVDIFTVAIDVDTINEEIVYVTNVSGDTLTISRGQAGTGTPGVSGIAHSAGASVKHVLTSSDLIFFRNSSSPAASYSFSGSTSGTTTIQASSVAGTNTLTLPPTSNDTLVGRATTDTLTNKTIDTASNTITGAVTLTGTQTLTNKTLTSPTIATPTITGGTSTSSILVSPEERTTVSATAATGTVNFDAATQGVLYYTTNASANFTLNVRGNSGTTLNSILATGDAITVVFLNTNGATPYYPTVYQVDGSTVTPKWQNGTAPTGGNASSIDAYSLTIIKTASTPTYTVLASQTKFA
jgi:hypothetical protein